MREIEGALQELGIEGRPIEVHVSMGSFGWLEDLGRWLDTAQTYRYILESDWNGHTGPILVSLAVWVALPLTLGTIRTLHREVS